MGLTPELIKKLTNKGFTDDQIKYIDKEVYMDFKRRNNYKIVSGNKYRIIRKNRNGTNVYYIFIFSKNKVDYLKEVIFRDCEAPNYDVCMIFIKKIVEYMFHKEKITESNITAAVRCLNINNFFIINNRF